MQKDGAEGRRSVQEGSEKGPRHSICTCSRLGGERAAVQRDAAAGLPARGGLQGARRDVVGRARLARHSGGRGAAARGARADGEGGAPRGGRFRASRLYLVDTRRGGGLPAAPLHDARTATARERAVRRRGCSRAHTRPCSRACGRKTAQRRLAMRKCEGLARQLTRSRPAPSSLPSSLGFGSPLPHPSPHLPLALAHRENGVPTVE